MFIGKKMGSRISNSRFVKTKYIRLTEEFYEKHGGKALTFARFVPILRTFASFIAGVSSMKYRRFLTFNVIG